jgi:hypothetical protein
MNAETHPYQVSVWIPGNNRSNSLFERGSWVEMARCITKGKAEEVALCLSLRHSSGVQVAELISDKHGARFIGFRFIPESSRELIAGKS